MGEVEIIRFANAEELAREAARRWLHALASRSPGESWCVALSGGRIAKSLFVVAAAIANGREGTFAGVHFFWGDERCVPPDHVESNFAVARECLLAPAGIPADHIHRMRGEMPAAWAAREAEAELCRIAPLDGAGHPVLDLVFLGMGEDGHVASLFPGAPADVINSSHACVPVIGPKPPPGRITMTYGVLAAARSVWVLASGAGKADALRRSLAPDGDTPLARVLRDRSRTLILTDVAAGPAGSG